MWEEDEEELDGAAEEETPEEGLDGEAVVDAVDKKAAAKKAEDEIDPASLSVSAKEELRRKLQADMEAFLKRGGNVTKVAADDSQWERETARAPDEDADE